jgi:flagellar protein FliL
MSKGADAGAEDGKGKHKKGKGNLVPAVVVAVGLLGAAFMMKGGGGGKAAAAAATAGGTTSTTVDAKTLAQVAKLDDITLNLADGHYLKLGLALQLGKKATVTDYTTGGAAARALDLAINLLGNDSYNQLMQPAGRAQAEAQLAKAVVAAYGGQVEDIYFTDFVMQ